MKTDPLAIVLMGVTVVFTLWGLAVGAENKDRDEDRFNLRFGARLLVPGVFLLGLVGHAILGHLDPDVAQGDDGPLPIGGIVMLALVLGLAFVAAARWPALILGLTLCGAIYEWRRHEALVFAASVRDVWDEPNGWVFISALFVALGTAVLGFFQELSVHGG